ncbi:hypothetical protein HMPREF1544_00695 [Mucor circinelloides 1006PhL]|uniref:Uncharacterized protein n=1 Tax=Mucor circinelloides f. circinelloides (strain 1006PhL) TaxID=1220926 RepID=S2JVH1_MUCC1|nr:hypothetical protein HMPREF1544_00695 [Mucor circinelloides 1006PhL]
MDKVFPPNSDKWNQWEMVKVLVQRQEASEESLAIHNKGALIKCHIAPSASNIDLNSPRGFRLLLSQIEFLLPENRNHITPLHISDSVISEMETLDMLNDTTWPELIETPPAADTMEWSNTTTMSKIYQQISSDNHICVIWIEDLDRCKSLASLI